MRVNAWRQLQGGDPTLPIVEKHIVPHSSRGAGHVHQNTGARDRELPGIADLRRGTVYFFDDDNGPRRHFLLAEIELTRPPSSPRPCTGGVRFRDIARRCRREDGRSLTRFQRLDHDLHSSPASSSEACSVNRTVSPSGSSCGVVRPIHPRRHTHERRGAAAVGEHAGSRARLDVDDAMVGPLEPEGRAGGLAHKTGTPPAPGCRPRPPSKRTLPTCRPARTPDERPGRRQRWASTRDLQEIADKAVHRWRRRCGCRQARWPPHGATVSADCCRAR